MSVSFQQQSRLRKLTYFGLILGIFCVTVGLRRGLVEPRASALELREENLGDVELTGSAVRLLLTGSRGLAVCSLWMSAMERQKKHEWNELELLVNSLTKLQPHFITPWVFQSWNLAYNVSVESDRVKDKYFYVTRGTLMLGQGERQNHDNPELRLHIGWYNQNKFGMSDENNMMRSLFRLSSIDPKLRDASRMRQEVNGQLVVDLDEFQKFCEREPVLVRRLRDKLRCDTPEKVVEFLAENRAIPSRYEDTPEVMSDPGASPLKADWYERFPLLPAQSVFDPRELTNDKTLAYDEENFDVARAWMKYAQDPLDLLGRKPRNLATVIFQSYPGRSQAYRAEFLEKGGWFDEEGWDIKDWFPIDRSRPAGLKKTVRVGTGRPWAEEGWREAHVLYRRHGIEHGLILDKEQLDRLTDADRGEYSYKRHVSNFPHFMVKTAVEQLPAAIEGRKHFYRAEALRREGQRQEAIKEYEHPSAFGPPSSWGQVAGWKKLLHEHPEFHAEQEEQVDLLETALKYMRLKEQLHAVSIKRLLVLGDFLAQAAARAPGATMYVPSPQIMRESPLGWKGPLDGTDEKGEPWIHEYVIHRVRGQMAQQAAGSSPPPGPMSVSPAMGPSPGAARP